MRSPLPLAFVAAIAVLASGCGHTAKHPPVHTRPATALGDFVGIYSDDVFFGDAAYRSATLAHQHAAGVGLIRQPFTWSDFAKEPARYDAFVGAAARAGIRVLPVIVGPQPGAPAATGGVPPPSDDAAFAAYAAQLVRRYGPNGSFWSSHADVPKLPIESWQVWNEPNIRPWWPSGPDAAAYAQLLELTGHAIRKADPRAEVVTAGLPTSTLGTPAPPFLDAVYRAGAKGSFDVVAVHAYAPTPQVVVRRVRDLLDVVARNGDSAQVWVTEFGWGTGGKPGPLTVSKPTQARYIAQTIALLRRERSVLRLRGFVLFQWRDPKPFAGRRDIWPFYAGLLDDQGRPKPSLKAFESAVARIRSAPRTTAGSGERQTPAR